jgi:hypothetical protein
MSHIVGYHSGLSIGYYISHIGSYYNDHTIGSYVRGFYANPAISTFGEIELAIVQGSLEPIKWHHATHLLLNRHDTLIFICNFSLKAKTISKLLFHSNSTFSNTANGCT